MTNQLSFTVCMLGNCDSMIFTETTGAYSTSNVTGWGTPNSDASDAQSAILTITNTKGIATTINLFSAIPAFPTTDKTQIYTITPSSLGYTTSKFPDGVYTFTYTVARTSATAFSYSQVSQQLFYCNARCCTDILFTKIDDWECECNKQKITEAYQADILLRALIRTSGCGDTKAFTNALNIINDLCETSSTCTECDN